MSTRRRVFFLVSAIVVMVAAVAWCLSLRLWPQVPQTYSHAGRPARIDPDYAGCTIPPNIAPLSFVVKETGGEYRVRVYSEQGEGFVVSSRTAGIVIPAGKWKALLELNRGNKLYFDVYSRGEQGQWRRFGTITNEIAREDVDSYLAYRRLKPVHNVYTNMGTYQRNVSTYDETPVLLSNPDSRRCVNCHTFVNNNPDTMCLHVRGGEAGAAMILAREGTATKIDTRTSFNASAASYISWHPSGRLAAFSANELMQFHHAVGYSRDVFDHNSDLCLYLVDSNSVTSTPEISAPDRLETFPTWSPDGRYLYFCSAERLWEKGLRAKKELPLSYRRVRYDLMRISCDVAAESWGKLETLLSAKETGLSINEPRVSPDGRFLLFCMSEYGCFPVYQQSCDLYMMDLESGRHWRLEINSERSDSWHCWSSNSRWIVFASKRRDGLFGRTYFSYIDPDGRAHKPLLLPQQDPTFYDSFLDNFNAPELITKPIRVGQDELLRAFASAEPKHAVFVQARRASGAASGGDATQEPTPEVPRKAVRIDHEEALRYYRRGQASEKKGDIEKAAEYYRLSVESLPRSHPSNIPASKRLAWIYSTHPSQRIRDGEEAVLLATYARTSAMLQIEHPRDERARRIAEAMLPGLIDTLAAAYAESGRFANAVHAALEAEGLALRRGQAGLAVSIHERLEHYLAGKPYRTAAAD